jgi:hypothetical protein
VTTSLLRKRRGSIARIVRHPRRAVGLLLLGCVATGPSALERMTPAQREFVAHGLETLSPASRPNELEAAFGGPPLAVAGSGREVRRRWRRAGAEPGECIEARWSGGRLVRLLVFDLGPTPGSARHPEPSSGSDAGRAVCAQWRLPSRPLWRWELVAVGDELVVAPR